MKNWWYYHKWYVICGALLICINLHLIGNKLGWFRDEPDIQIAYIADEPLSEDAAASIENAFSSLADDYNKDGKVTVKINQYLNAPDTGDVDSLSYKQAAELSIIGDIESCSSYFFLMERPQNVQREFQVLALPDGSCPLEFDLSAEGKTIRWDDKLYLGRRCFYHNKRTAYEKECSQLWDTIYTKYAKRQI